MFDPDRRQTEDQAVAAERERARQFVDFVLRHTWPERAKDHGYATVYSLILHHPFVKDFIPTPKARTLDNAEGEG